MKQALHQFIGLSGLMTSNALRMRIFDRHAWHCRARHCLVAVLSLMACAGSWAEFPDRPIVIIVPYPVGGATDTLSRVVGAKLGELLKTSVVIDNRAGGSGMIGLNAAARLPADGYTMFLGAVSDIAIFAAASANTQPANLERDFTAVAGLASAPHILVVPTSISVNDMEQLIVLLKKSPGAHNFASIGVATLSQLEGTILMQTTGVDIVHVPYRGGAQALQELIVGNTSLMFLSGPNAMPHVRSGRVKILATASEQRLPLLPNVPTMAEAGIKGFSAPNRFGFYAVKDAPPKAIQHLTRALEKVLDDPEVRSRLEQQGMLPKYIAPAEFNRQTTEDFQYFSDLVKRSKIRLE